MPSFVKAHGHDEPVLIGLRKEDILTQWLDHVVNPFSKFLNHNQRELTELLGADPYLVVFRKSRLDDLQFGITSYVAHQCNYNKYHVDELVQANDEVGVQAVIAIGGQDRNYNPEVIDTVGQAVARLDVAYAKHGQNRNCRIIPGPDQDFSNSPAMLTALKQWSKAHWPHLLHIHSSEEFKTTANFVKQYGQTPIEYFHSLGILDGDTFVAHQIQSTENDLRILQETRTPVVNNPLANTILMSGMLKYPEFERMGLIYAVSTDGNGSADNQNIIQAGRLARQWARS